MVSGNYANNVPSNNYTLDVEWHACDLCTDGRLFRGKRGLSQHMSWHRRRDLSSASDINPNTTPLPTNTLSREPLWQKLLKLKHNAPVLKRIPRGARITVARSLAETLINVVQLNSLESWENLLTFAYRVLHIASNKNKNKKVRSLTSQVRQNTSNTNLPEIINNPKFHVNNSRSKKVEEKVSEGNIKGAAKLLFSQDVLAPDNDDTWRALQSKHPQCALASYPLPNQTHASLEATIGTISSAIASFPGGSAGGVDGITPQHLKDLTSKSASDAGPLLLSAIVSFTDFLLTGEVHPEITPILYGANLCALKKKDGGIRPIAVGSTFRRIASKVCCKSLIQSLSDTLQPVQLGVGCKGGCEAAVHAARTFVNNSTSSVFLKVDVKNAFNSVNRRAFLKEIENHSPNIYPYLCQCYGTNSKLMYHNKEIISSSGCQQGDPLGPALFSLAIHPVISNLNSKFNVWYLDDGSLGGDVDTVLHDLQTIITKFAALDLEINFDKCELYIPESFSDTEIDDIFQKFNTVTPGIKIKDKNSLTLLGSPIFVESLPNFLNSKITCSEDVLNRLSQIKSHIALYLIRHCLFTPKFTYYLRSCPIWKFPDLTLILDNILKKQIERILNTSLDYNSWSQATLPARHGGLGTRKISDVALPAFLSSVHSTYNLVGRVLNPPSGDFEVVYMSEAKDAWSRACPGESFPDNPNIQKLWDLPLVEKQHVTLRHSMSSLSDKARFLAVSEFESGHWLNALPSNNIGTLLEDSTLRLAVSLRLGLKVCEPHRCPCGQVVDQLGHHGLSCPKSAGRCYRHSSLNDLIRRSFVSVSIPASLEPTGLFRDDGKRPDGMTIVPWEMGRSLVWDATCADTLAPSHLPNTSVQAGAAAESAQIGKHRKYSEIASSHIFAAFAVETLGPWSSDAKILYRKLASKLIDTSGDPRAGSYLAQRISIAIQRGNAASMLGTMPMDNGLDTIFVL